MSISTHMPEIAVRAATIAIDYAGAIAIVAA
jgi:hypothetical protein